MDHGILKKVILEQHEIIRNMNIIPRSQVIQKEDNRILVGIRRSGKTTMLYHLVRQIVEAGADWRQIMYINFEDERLDGFSPADFDDILAVKAELTEKEGWFFFDEIQNIPKWEKFCRRLADSHLHVFITGSNATMLSREMESTLGGRYLSTLVFPYSFREFLNAEGVACDREAMLLAPGSARIVNAFDEYMHSGGFPESILKVDKREYVSSVYRKVIEGDIITRHGIRNPAALRLMVKKLAESVKDTVSGNRIASSLRGAGIGVNVQTVIDYLSYMEDAYLVFPVRNWFSPFTEKESVMKHYFIDPGMLSLFLVDKDPLLLENAVAAELYRRNPADTEGRVFFLRSVRTGLDIDFYLPAENTLIQVSYRLDSSSRDREVKALIKAGKLMQDVSRFLLLTLSESEHISASGIEIEVMPVWKWLLDG